ncbi:unnamed protein product [Cuscuta campestris]|uniref:Uncharacterized protein n=1 Tax=Cuscuta campestris TaxID=132261 RepID=A0A484NHD7_9ASTE|nr:unnamed protein product [Cuscuta campestris]
MATSAFKSTTKRAPIGGVSGEVSSSCSSSSTSSYSGNRANRRSRSLSRFSRRLPFGEEPPEAAASSGFEPTPRRKFVNTVRGSGSGSAFPEISLDDLAQEFFSRRDEEIDSSDPDHARSARRGSDIGRWASETASSQRRGRSVSRQSSRNSGDRKSIVSDRSRVSNGLPEKAESNSRRRRSVSSVRYQISDSESDADHSRKQGTLGTTKSLGNTNNGIPSYKSTAVNGPRSRRPINQKDPSRLHDGYSSHSSALTDDELKDHSGKSLNEKIIHAVYSQKQAEHPTQDDINSGLYEAMKKGLRYAVEEFKVELEQGLTRKSGNHSQLDSAIRSTYVARLEESEKHNQDILAEMLDDQKGRELSRIIAKNSAAEMKSSRTRNGRKVCLQAIT